MSKLAPIAEAMTLTAEAVGTAQHRLRRGLILTLRHNDRARTLSLTRYNRPPGEHEETTCRKAGMQAYLPLWKEDQRQLLAEFIEAGFESVVITVKSEYFGEDILGKKIDSHFVGHLDELAKTKDITPAGEAGEYHSLVIDGPLFKKRLEIRESETIEKDGYRFLQVHQAELVDK